LRFLTAVFSKSQLEQRIGVSTKPKDGSLLVPAGDSKGIASQGGGEWLIDLPKIEKQMSQDLLGPLETVDPHDRLGTLAGRESSIQRRQRSARSSSNPRGSTVQGMRLDPIESLVPEKGPVFWRI
jgi:hypothetical protein